MLDVAARASALLGSEPVDPLLPRPRIARIATHASVAAVLDDWSELERHSALTPYQTRAWLIPWIETIGARAGARPLFILAYDDGDRPIALLPLAVWTKPMLTLATFLGGKDSNFNMGLFRRGFRWLRADVLKLLRDGARLAPVKLDLYVLRNQPLGWDGTTNPLAGLRQQPSPSFAYKAALTRDPEAFLKAGVSRDSRKKLRQKTNRLRSLGAVEHRRARTAEELGAVLDAFFEQRLARVLDQGLPSVDQASLRAFLERATAATDREGGVEFHALYCGDRIVATFAGAQRGNRFCGMLTSFASGPEMARMSTGELLLAAVIGAKCAEGCETLDLGVGEARYKDTYCPDTEPLFESLVALTAVGAAFAAAERVRIRLKRSIKQSGWAWTWTRRIRRIGSDFRRRRAPAG